MNKLVWKPQGKVWEAFVDGLLVYTVGKVEGGYCTIGWTPDSVFTIIGRGKTAERAFDIAEVAYREELTE